MKKKFIILLVTAIFCLGSFSSLTAIKSVKSLIGQNIEALSDQDAGMFVRNFRSATVWYPSSYYSYSSTYLYLEQNSNGDYYLYYSQTSYTSITWSSMTCCIDGSNTDFCNFALEDDLCPQLITRAPL